ncbi:MAG: GH3 auxin-responsive promoter family protein [Acetobacterium woodii]|nr:GH3 auxin-responsive promoter family protein [Acetobacterium woodii]
MIKILPKMLYSLNIKKGNKKIEKFDYLTENAPEINKQLMLDMLKKNAETEYGKKYHFSEIATIEDYKKMVPFSIYDDYAPYIERMIAGETDLITKDPIVHYALTSGSVDNPKKIPVSEQTVKLYREYATQFSFAIIARALGKKWKRGRGLNLMEVKFETLPNGLFAGSISGRGVYSIKNLLFLMFTSPKEIVFPTEIMDTKYAHLRFALMDRNLTYIVSAFMTGICDLMKYLETNWEIIVDDIEKGTINPDIKIPDEVKVQLQKQIKPDPKRAAELRVEFKKGFETPIVRRIWPDFAFVHAIGSGGFAVYTDKMRHYLGDVPIYFSVYAASESIMAICNEMESQEFVLIPDSAFYEFIPVDQEDSEETLTMEQLETGKDYEIVLTNTSGFYRYRIKDVVRVVGWYKNCPKIQFVYRLNQMVSIAGEKTTEECISWAVKEFAKDTECELVDYSVYADVAISPGRYVIIMETEKRMSKENHEKYRIIIEEKLGIANPSIGSKVKSGILSPSEITFVQEETYALYRDLMIMRGISGNQLKPVRVIDTLIKENFFFALVDKE